MLFWLRAILFPCIGERASTLWFQHLYDINLTILQKRSRSRDAYVKL